MQISKVIKKHGYTIDEVENIIGCSKGAIRGRICKRKGAEPNLQINTLRAIAKAIDCQMTEFFEDENIQEPTPLPQEVQLDIKSQLKKARVTQKTLAEHINVTPQYMSYMLRFNKIYVEQLMDFAKFLNVPVEAFFVRK